ncbi:MAG TPA: ROK family protein [Candidatus Binataceae bacterium]|nr:ROK family protein [Candidatus Binataceae bacterium]
MKKNYVVGLDMGGTNIRTAAVSKNGEVLLMLRGPAQAKGTARETVTNICAQILALEDRARRHGLGRAIAIGVAVPGPLNVLTGVIYAAPHVKAWRSFPLRRNLEHVLKRSVTVENDANAWALGEYWRGAARGRKNVVLLTLGTGVGGGLIVDGNLVHGRSGMAAELGHVTVEPNGMPCDCGNRGCLEAYASASGLCGLLKQRLQLDESPLPAKYLDRGGEFSARKMSSAARVGDRIASEIFETAGRYLGIAIASFINTFNPEMVVIGGGVAGAFSLMRPAMISEVKARAFRAAVGQTRIVKAALGAEGGVVGAAFAALRAN